MTIQQLAKRIIDANPGAEFVSVPEAKLRAAQHCADENEQLALARELVRLSPRSPERPVVWVLYIDADGEWFLSGNAGPLEIECRGDIEAMIADAPEGTDTREAQNLLETIIDAEANPTATGDPVTDIEALSLADRDIAKIMGWVA